MTFTSSAALVGHLVAALAERRRALGIKQRELDDKAGFADGLCEKYEAGVRVPSVQALTWWASALGCRLTLVDEKTSASINVKIEILGGEASMPRNARFERTLALLYLSQGMSVSEAARRVGMSRQIVWYWQQRVKAFDNRHARPFQPATAAR